MGVTIQIRGIDEMVRDRLKARAALEGDSLNTYLKRLLSREAERPSQAEVFERARRRSERSAISSVGLIRADRDARSQGTETS